jgi:hypothetical protein
MKESSFISDVQWTEDKTLWVRLKSGLFYTYDNVPESVYKDFLAAESLGKFFTKEVKGFYTETRHEEVTYRTQPAGPFDGLEEVEMSPEEEEEFLREINDPYNQAFGGATS